MLGRMLLFTGPPQAADGRTGRAGRAPGRARPAARQALEALELYTVAFGAQVPDAAERLARVRAAGLQKGWAACSAALPLGTGRCGAAPHRSARARTRGARRRLADRPGRGFHGPCRRRVLAVADRDEALTVCEAALSAAHQMGSLIGVSSVNAWRGWTWLARGELAEAEDALREGSRGSA